MDLGLKDKVAVVAASSKGLGKAVAWQLAREGAKLVICARNKEILEALSNTSIYVKARMIRDLHGKQEETKLNFTEEDALTKMKKQFVNEWSIIKEEDRELLKEKLEQALAISASKRESVAA